jgi:hypothetical protein
MDLFRKTMMPFEQVFKDANVKKDIDEIVLVAVPPASGQELLWHISPDKAID